MIYGLPLAIIVTAVCCFVLIKVYLKDNTPISTAFLDDVEKDVKQESSLNRNIVIVVILVTVGLWLTSAWHGISHRISFAE